MLSLCFFGIFCWCSRAFVTGRTESDITFSLYVLENSSKIVIHSRLVGCWLFVLRVLRRFSGISAISRLGSRR